MKGVKKMSRCVLDNEETGCEAVIGWDPPLNTFFAQVFQKGEDEPLIWLGVRPGEYPSNPDPLIRAVLPYCRPCSETVLRANLLQDMQQDDERSYSIDGETVW